jgi:large-conductance mechanosensitive channel
MNNFKEMITQFNIVGLAIGFIIAANLKDLAEGIITDLLMPFIKPILERMTADGGLKYKIGKKIELDLNNIVTVSIKFLFLSLIIFILMSQGVKISRPISWVEVKNFPLLVNNLKNVK